MSSKSSDRFDGVLLGKLDYMTIDRTTILCKNFILLLSKELITFLELDDFVPLNYY